MILDPFKTSVDGHEWALFSRARGVFVGASRVEDTRLWRSEYQGAAMCNNAFDGRFKEIETQQPLDLLNGY